MLINCDEVIEEFERQIRTFVVLGVSGRPAHGCARRAIHDSTHSRRDTWYADPWTPF
jgi:hypothetical protein